MLQEFCKGGGDMNARDAYTTLQPDVPNSAPAESAVSTAGELPALAENKCYLGLPL